LRTHTHTHTHPQAVAEFVRSGEYKGVRDFDEHLDAVTADPFNTRLALAGAALVWSP
jgi:hypothetical protein